jgi:glycerol-3-phosphate acyltransferase PlsY
MNDWLEFVPLMFAAYLLGSIPSAYLAARWARGIDIRRVGTHNVGASNVLQTTSKWLAVPVIIVDIGKGALAVWLTRVTGFSTGLQAVAGLAAIAGHNWPVFLGFRGGRGIATSLGVIIVLSPVVGLIALVGAYSFAAFRQMGLGVFMILLLLPFMSWFFAVPFGIENRTPVTLGYAAITFIAYMRRLIHHRTALSRDTPEAELLVNRLLFDRDIRDRNLWVHSERASRA